MKNILCIDTATRPCSVAILVDGSVAFSKETFEGPNHASLLGVFTQEAMEFAKEQNLKIEAVAVSCGPGSYTGLRIGVSLAKGICFGLNIPLIPIHTLPLLATTALEQVDMEPNALICPMIDARRMEVYAAIYNKQMEIIKPVSADIIDEESYVDYKEQGTLYLVGDGAAKCYEPLRTSGNVVLLDEIYPLAKNMWSLVEKAIEDGAVLQDPAYFEPFYLKEFVATTPKKNLF